MFRRKTRQQKDSDGIDAPKDQAAPAEVKPKKQSPKASDAVAKELELDLFADKAAKKSATRDRDLLSELEAFEIEKCDPAVASDANDETDDESLVDIGLDEGQDASANNSEVVNQLQREIMELRVQLGASEGRRLAVEQDAKIAAEKSHALEAQLRESQSETDKLQAELARASDALVAADQQASESQTKIDGLQEQVQSLEHSSSSASDDTHRLQIEYADLDETHKQLTKSFKNLQQQLNDRETEGSQLRSELDQASGACNSAKMAAENALAELAQEQSRNEQIGRQNESQQSEVARLTAELQTANRLIAELKAVDSDPGLAENVARLETELAAANEKLSAELAVQTQNRQKIQELSSQLESATDHSVDRGEFESLERLVSELRSDLEAERSAHRVKIAQVSDLTAALQAAKEQSSFTPPAVVEPSTPGKTPASISDAFFAAGMSNAEMQTYAELSASAQQRLKELDTALDRMQEELSTVESDNVDLSIEPRYSRRPR